MRKQCALILTAFYLVLTTGVYVCLAHCAIEFIGKKAGLTHNVVEHSKDSDKDDEPCDENCKCCYHHGVYVVQENFKPETNFHFSHFQQTILPKLTTFLVYIPRISYNAVSWPQATGPPLEPHTKLYISYRSILI